LQTFTGPGVVWLAPTQVIYDRIKLQNGIYAISHPQGSMGADT
jgi:hypothetical protein